MQRVEVVVRPKTLSLFFTSLMVDDNHIKWHDSAIISWDFFHSILFATKDISGENQQKVVRERGKIPESLWCWHKIPIKIIAHFGPMKYDIVIQLAWTLKHVLRASVSDGH